MHILLVNDDGIKAPGIIAMAEALLADGHRISVCAPDRERSAASHSTTMNGPLHVSKYDFPGAEKAWAIDGTPADSARMGLFLLKDDPVDLVISGINKGSNLGGAGIYSGTVAGAMEASMSEVPGLAVSLCIRWNEPYADLPADYGASAKVGARVANWMMEQPRLPRGAIYNLNVPYVSYEKIKGVVPATLSPIFLDEPLYRVEQDESGNVSYYYKNGTFPPMDDPEYDAVKIRNDYATITKLTWDLRLNADHSEINTITL